MTEYDLLCRAIETALKNDEPDNIYYELDRQVEDALANNLLSAFEYRDLLSTLRTWWDERDRTPDDNCLG